MPKTMVNHIADNLEQVKGIMAARGKSPEMPLTTLPDFNRKIWGIQRGKMMVIGGRTSTGKTSFALQVAYDIASQGHPVLYLSLEMTEDELLERLFCHTQRIDNFELLSGHFAKYQLQFNKFCEDMSFTELAITDCMGKSWQEIEKYLLSLTVLPKVIILDYIQRITKGVNTKKEIDDYINGFADMVKKHNFAGIFCSQINRANQDSDDKEPQLHQLKYSGVLEEAVDLVILLSWPHRYDDKFDKRDFKLILAKNRNGRIGYVELKYYPEYYLFTEQEIQTEAQPANWNEKE